MHTRTYETGPQFPRGRIRAGRRSNLHRLRQAVKRHLAAADADLRRLDQLRDLRRRSADLGARLVLLPPILATLGWRPIEVEQLLLDFGVDGLPEDEWKLDDLGRAAFLSWVRNMRRAADALAGYTGLEPRPRRPLSVLRALPDAGVVAEVIGEQGDPVRAWVGLHVSVVGAAMAEALAGRQLDPRAWALIHAGAHL